MKRKIIFCFVMLIISISVNAQINLVPNPSFEDYTQCPNGADEVDSLIGWINYGCSPDYFNSCAGTSIVGVPCNFAGCQPPPEASENAYCGVLTYESPALYGAINYREYIGEQLSANLIIGTKYYVSIKANCAKINNLGPSNCASNNLGVKFSMAPYNPYHFPNPPNNSQIKTNAIITDTMNWTMIFGSFISDSAYQYIIIGNFYDDNHTDTLILNSDSTCEAYYYVDDICVSTDSSYTINYIYTGINELRKQPYLTIYPNPATNYLNIDFPSLASFYEIEIFDVFGREVLIQKITEQNTLLDISNVSEGILLIKISFNNQHLFYKLLKL